MRIKPLFVSIMVIFSMIFPLNTSQAAGGDPVGTFMPVTGTAHVQNLGWINATQDGVFGTTGKSLRLEAISIKGWPVAYQVNVKGKGWSDWCWNGEECGTTGESRMLEGIRIRQAPGVAESGYKLTYRAHVQNIGWMAWTEEWHGAGTKNMNLRLEAVQVRVVKTK